MQNPYQTLGVDRNATADEIKRAYRKLASQHHPDKGGDTHLFQNIQKAYDLLGDPQKRAEYDNPGMNFHGSVGGQPFDFDTIFDIFGARFQRAPGAQPRARTQARMSLWITLTDSAQGGRKTVSIGTHYGTQAVEIEIPQGINDGDTVQYPGLAPGGVDLLITYRIHPDPRWQRQGNNLVTDQTVSVWDCILGCEITIRDIFGNQLSLTVPARTNPGTMLRLRGKGMSQKNQTPGDLLIRIQCQMPNIIDQDLLDMIEKTRSNK